MQQKTIWFQSASHFTAFTGPKRAFMLLLQRKTFNCSLPDCLKGRFSEVHTRVERLQRDAILCFGFKGKSLPCNGAVLGEISE